jgi:hypothetical protein
MLTKRPLLITLASVWIVISAGIMTLLAFSGFADLTAAWYPMYLGLAGIAYLGSAVGLWMMKKWGLFLLGLFSVVNQVVLFSLNRFSVVSLVISVIVLAVCASQYSKLK